MWWGITLSGTSKILSGTSKIFCNMPEGKSAILKNVNFVVAGKGI